MAVESSQGHSPAERLVVRSPRSAAIAGLVFAILFSLSVIILKLSVVDLTQDEGQWLNGSARWISFAVGLMPFAGIFFLWFVAVVRARLGRFEDQFFSTVFLGSGLLFLAMVFIAAALAGAIVLGYQRNPDGFAGSDTYYLARDGITQIFGIYGLRMAAVFMLSQASLWFRTRVMPRWITFLTFPIALLLLFVYGEWYWVLLVFPAWVFLVSAYILVVSFARQEEAFAGD
jgi:hypothetical protein